MCFYVVELHMSNIMRRTWPEIIFEISNVITGVGNETKCEVTSKNKHACVIPFT